MARTRHSGPQGRTEHHAPEPPPRQMPLGRDCLGGFSFGPVGATGGAPRAGRIWVATGAGAVGLDVAPHKPWFSTALVTR